MYLNVALLEPQLAQGPCTGFRELEPTVVVLEQQCQGITYDEGLRAMGWIEI